MREFTVILFHIEDIVDRLFWKSILIKCLSPVCNCEIYDDKHMYLDLFKKTPHEATEPELKKVLKKEGLAIKHIRNPSHKLQLTAVEQNPTALGTILKMGITPADDVISRALTMDPFAISLIHNPTIEQQLMAVAGSGEAIQYIHKPSEEVLTAAVDQSPHSILWVEAPSHEFQLLSVTKNGRALASIIQSGISPHDDILIAAVTNDPTAIQYIINPIDELQIFAVRSDPMNLYYMLMNGSKPCDEALNLSKDGIIKDLLTIIKKYGFEKILDHMNLLQDAEIRWEELEVIDRSMAAYFKDKKGKASIA